VIKSGTIQLPATDPMTGTGGSWTLNTAGGAGGTYLSPDIPFAPPWSGAPQPFSSPPTVVVSLAGMAVAGGPPRFRLSVENVQAEEFNIRVTAEPGTTLDNVSVTWLADDGA
jgi:hypothetical protein